MTEIELLQRDSYWLATILQDVLLGTKLDHDTILDYMSKLEMIRNFNDEHAE